MAAAPGGEAVRHFALTKKYVDARKKTNPDDVRTVFRELAIDEEWKGVPDQLERVRTLYPEYTEDELYEDVLDDALHNLMPVVLLSLDDLKAVIPDTLTLDRILELNFDTIVHFEGRWQKLLQWQAAQEFVATHLPNFRAIMMADAKDAQFETDLMITRLRLLQLREELKDFKTEEIHQAALLTTNFTAWTGSVYGDDFYGAMAQERKIQAFAQADELASFIRKVRPVRTYEDEAYFDSFHIVQQNRRGWGSACKKKSGIPWEDLHCFSSVAYYSYSGNNKSPIVRLRVPRNFPMILQPGGEQHCLFTILHGSTYEILEPEPWTGTCLRCKRKEFEWKSAEDRTCKPTPVAAGSGPLLTHKVLAICEFCGYVHGCPTFKFRKKAARALQSGVPAPPSKKPRTESIYPHDLPTMKPPK